MEGPEEIFVNTYSAMKAYQTDTSGFQESIKPLQINALSTLRNLECAPSNALYFRAKACASKSISSCAKYYIFWCLWLLCASMGFAFFFENTYLFSKLFRKSNQISVPVFLCVSLVNFSSVHLKGQ